MINNICKLCKRESMLKASHILPEFFYSGIYDEIHRAIENSLGKETIIQKGYREYLLCGECETKLSQYEGYAAKLIRKIPESPKDVNGRFLYLENVDYQQFKLFQLSILWRASISKRPAFKKVSLGSYQNEAIRQMLNDGKPGKPTSYACMMMTMLNTEILHKVIAAPTPVEPNPFGGWPLYKFPIGNITWLFFATSNYNDIQAEEFFLQENGILRIWLAKDEETVILNLGKILHSFKKK